ncbi:MAG TPA: response regulator transcription factor [Anaerolineae bacterium]|jgi:two-component system KDP operon response regulator KdpE|nr:response regulator transcription factor [Anaerolineae bacterium]
MTEARILVVEDEPKLVRLVREVLTATGYEVLTTNNGARAIELMALEQPDLMLLDLVLTDDIDGLEVTRRVRDFSDIPIIMLTAKSTESDVLHGFDAGADDYITKPFSSKELLARVRALLKRARHEVSEASDSRSTCGDLQIDFARRRVSKTGQNIHLTRTEYNLLYELASHPNQVMLHEQLLTAVWGPEYRDDLDYLRAYIRYLRRKLETDPSNPQYIVTSPGVGYMLECPDEAG